MLLTCIHELRDVKSMYIDNHETLEGWLATRTSIGVTM